MSYDDDLSAIAWNDGWKVGYNEGRDDTVKEYEQRLAAYWTELATLNARVDYIEKTIGGFK